MTDLALFADVQAVLDLALSRGGVAYHAKTTKGVYSRGAAVKFIQRAYTFRRLLRANKPAPPGEITRTPYDNIVLNRACGCAINLRCDHDNGHVVHITLAPPPEVTDFEGNQLPVTSEGVRALEADDELTASAIRVRRELLDEDD